MAMDDTQDTADNGTSNSSGTPRRAGSLYSANTPSQPSADTASLFSLRSVDSVPVTGMFPLGTLRISNSIVVEESEEENAEVAVQEPPKRPSPIDADYNFLTSGDVFIYASLPAKFTVGYDTVSFTTSQPFLGVRDIPAGAHLFWVAHSESTSSRSAYWIFTPEKGDNERGRVFVRQWDNYNEILTEPLHTEQRDQMERLGQTFPNLASYQCRASTSAVSLNRSKKRDSDPLPHFVSNTTMWYQLTSAITPTLLNRITGQVQKCWPVNTTDRVAGDMRTQAESALYRNSSIQLRFMFPMSGLLFDPAAEGEERTRQAMDPTSWLMSGIVNPSHEWQEADLIGEVQFAFITGMHLGNYSCLDQWWHFLTKIVFRAHGLVLENPNLARSLIQTFHSQLVYNDRYLEGSILEMMPENAKKLQKTLTTYKARLDEVLLSLGDRCTPDQAAVGASFTSLESWLWKYGWDLRGEYLRSGNVMLEDGEVVQAELSDFEDEDERGEFAAVVVDLDDQGRQTDLVSWD